MHSRIYGLRLVTDDINKDFDVISDNQLDFERCQGFADYIDGVEQKDWRENIAWLHGNYSGSITTIEDKGIFYLQVSKAGLLNELKKDFLTYKSLVRKLKFEDFVNIYSSVSYEIKSALDDNTGFHVLSLWSATDDAGGGDLDTYQGFMRTCLFHMNRHNLDSITFRVEGVIDYHF